MVGEGRNLGENGRLLIDVLSWCVLEGKEENREDFPVASVSSRKNTVQTLRQCNTVTGFLRPPYCCLIVNGKWRYQNTNLLIIRTIRRCGLSGAAFASTGATLCCRHFVT